MCVEKNSPTCSREKGDHRLRLSNVPNCLNIESSGLNIRIRPAAGKRVFVTVVFILNLTAWTAVGSQGYHGNCRYKGCSLVVEGALEKDRALKIAELSLRVEKVLTKLHFEFLRKDFTVLTSSEIVKRDSKTATGYFVRFPEMKSV